jgi:hypothetical protein
MQPTLFDEPGDAHEPEPSSRGNAPHLARVRAKIGDTVLAFLRARLAEGKPEFVMAELHAHVVTVYGVAPASPDRILRDLRAKGLCDYEVVNRRRSRYRVASVAAETQGDAA